jgi:hypothetical protein
MSSSTLLRRQSESVAYGVRAPHNACQMSPQRKEFS